MIPTNKVKVNLLQIVAALMITVTLSAAESDDEPYTIFPAEWKTRNSATRRFDTPLGALYEFRPGDMYIASPYRKAAADSVPPHKPNCNCMECVSRHTMSSLQCAIPRKAQEKRFIAIDFVVRQFPAFDAPENRELHFILTQSDNSGIAEHYLDLNSTFVPAITTYGSMFQDIMILPPYTRSYPMIVTGKGYRPKFEPLSIRIIYDNTSSGLLYFIVNGERYYLPKFETIPDHLRPPFRSFGFCVQKWGALPAANLELSEPKLIAFDREDTLLKFLTGQFHPYPYAAYDRDPTRKDSRKLRSNRNPDFIYANAMHLLYGTDPGVPLNPEEGVRQLQRAIRDGHVFAMYKLGICYFRGLGVRKNDLEALKLFEKAAATGYSRAVAMAYLLKIRQQLGNSLTPWEFCRQVNHESESFSTGELVRLSRSADPAYLLQMLNSSWGGSALEQTRRDLLRYGFLPDLQYGKIAVADQARETSFRINSSQFQNSKFPDNLPIRLKANAQDQRDFERPTVDELRKALYEELYAPAGYALGLRLESLYRYRVIKRPVEEVNQEIDRALELAAAGGFVHADLIRWRRALAAGQPPPPRTAQFEFAFADEPWFLLFRFAEQHPEHRVVKTFLRNHNKLSVLKALENDATANGDYLRALFTLIDETGPLKTVAQRINPGDRPLYTPENYALLPKSLPDTPDAQYLIGKFLLENPDELPAIPEITDKPARPLFTGPITRGKFYLQQAAEAGHLKARYLLARSDSLPAKALELLKPLREAEVIEGWLLTAEIQEKNYGFARAREAYQQAAALGAPEAYSALALNTTDPVKKRVLWHSFLTVDKRKRILDPFDIYTTGLKVKQHLISSDLLRPLTFGTQETSIESEPDR